MQSYVDDKLLAGSLVLLVRHGKVVYLRGFGDMDRERGKPMREDTIFRIASMTKAVTSVAVMMLFEEGRFLLEDPVHKYIPAFKGPRVLVTAPGGGDYELVPATREITIRDLLRHTSGISYGFLGGEQIGRLYSEAGVSNGLIQTEGTIGEMVERIAAQPLLSQPGEAWVYGLNTDVLGYLVEILSGQTLAAFLQERIFTPLRMTDTHFFLPADKVARLAALYRPTDAGIERTPNGRQKVGAAVFSGDYHYSGPTSYFSGGAGLASTIGDYARFLQMVLNGGELDGVHLLGRKTVELMTVNHIGDLETLVPGHGFGLGFSIHKGPGVTGGIESTGTFGWGGFFHTNYWVDPQERMFGLFMSQIFPGDHSDAQQRFRTLAYQAIVD